MILSLSKLSCTVGQLVTERPARARIFETFGIDYCCGGKKSLAQACADRKVDPNTVAGILDAFDDETAAAHHEPDWSKASPAELADHIESTHHAYLKNELPRLDYLVHKAANRHGDRDPRLGELARCFTGFRAELELHMAKEERVLFPLCRQLSDATVLPDAYHTAHLDNPVAVLTAEHDDAGHALKRMRDLTDGFTPPPGACNTLVVMLEGLAHLEQDMHRHVHKENSILFPAALDAERRLRALRDQMRSF